MFVSRRHTAHGDIAAELAGLREKTVEHTGELRDLELRRFDEMTAGLWPQIRAGSPPAVTAAIRVSERRARLLGLDEPVVTKSEVIGSLSLTAQSQFKAQAEELKWLDLDELEDLAAKSSKLMDDANRTIESAEKRCIKLPSRRSPRPLMTS